jgi:spore coat protein A
VTPSRRSVLRLAGLAGVAAGGLTACGGTNGQTGEQLRTRAPLPAPFTRPLPRPATLRPAGTAGGVDTYRVTARQAEAEILPGLRTRILGYDGTFPGPTIESRRGRTTVVEHVNELPVPMVVHLHGGEVPADSDGFPTDLVMPASPGARLSAGTPSAHGSHDSMTDPDARVVQGSRRYTYPMEQAAATLWYHDHRMDFTGPAVYRGLAGFHLVRDDEEDALPLPRGDRELPLMIADRSFDEDGQFDYPARDPSMTREPGTRPDAVEGVLGDVVLVNGVPWPQAEVDAARYRLRFLNASNARRYELVLDPPPPAGDPFTQIGSDGGLLERPAGHSVLRMAPAERFDVVVDFSRYAVGTKVTVRNRLGSGGTADVMRFVVARRAADDSRVPELLRPFEVLTPPPGAVRRAFRFRRGDGGGGGRHWWKINGEAFDPTRMMATVRPGEVERWRFSSDLHHPVHVHLAQFQVLSRGAGGPHPLDAGWKDTVDLRPADDVEVAIRFPDLPGRYVMHCHNLEHEDMAMMAAFEVR